jgi:hypothetical protein
MSTTIESAVHLDAVADDLATAVLADGCQSVGCTLEAVEDVTLPGGDDLKGLVVLVSAHFALTHGEPPDAESVTPPVSTRTTAP